MKATIEQVKEIVSVLTNEEQQLIKDTIIHGGWGDFQVSFISENGEIETDWCYVYCTNDAHKAGNFKGRIVATMFRSIYKKMCSNNNNQVGRYISHCNDWWGDGSGDMLFIRKGFWETFESWAYGKQNDVE